VIAFLFITLLALGALSARGQSGAWHSLMSAPNEFRNAWLSSDKSTIAAESWSGYFIIFEIKTGRVLRQSAFVPRILTGSYGGVTNSAHPSITQDSALVLTSEFNLLNQYLELIDVRTGVTLKKIDLRALLPDTARGSFADLLWDQTSGIVTLGYRTRNDSRYIDGYYQLSLHEVGQLVHLNAEFDDGSDPSFCWVHPFVVDRAPYPTKHHGFKRAGEYLLMSDSLKTIMYKAPSTEALWMVDEIPLALIDSIVVTVDVGSQRTHHRRVHDGRLIRSFQYDQGCFWAYADDPRGIFESQSPSQRYIQKGTLIIDLLNGSTYQAGLHASIGITDDGDLIQGGEPHGAPLRYALRKTGYRIQTPPQFIGTVASVLEAPGTDKLFYSTRGACRSLGGYIAGVVGEIMNNIATVGLMLEDGGDVNDQHGDGFHLYSVPTSTPGPSRVFACIRLFPSFSPIQDAILFDPQSMSKIGESAIGTGSYLDPLRDLFYVVDATVNLAGVRVRTFESTYQPNPLQICNDTLPINGSYLTHIVKGTGQLVNGKYIYDGKTCVTDSLSLGSVIAVGTMRPLAVLASNDDLILVDMSTSPVVESWRTTISKRISVSFSDVDHSVRCVDSAGRLHNINVQDGTVESISLPSWPDSVLRIHWSADGSLITAEPRGDQMITTWDHRGTLLRQLPYPDLYDRRIIVTSESARVFVTTNNYSDRSGFTTWWSDGLKPTPTTVNDLRSDQNSEILFYPVRVYTTIGQFVTTLATESDLTMLHSGLYILTTASGQALLRLFH